jgi:uncharacterized protein (TIGR03435 family)
MKRGLLAAAVLVLASSAPLFPQGTGPSFDVASVRPSPANPGTPFAMFSSMNWPPGRFTANRTTVRSLVRFAYEVPDYLIEGGPAWAASEPFDITATVPEDATVNDRQAMLRTLSAERFHLLVHEEVRDAPVYELVVAREDGRFGPGLTRPDDSIDCEQVETERRANMAEQPRRFRENPSLLPEGPTCGNLSSSRPTPDGGTQAAWSAGREPVTTLTGYLAPQVRRPVIDRTGLAGEFDFRLEYIEPGLGTSQADGNWPTPVDVPALFVALEEQLGLKLEDARGPVTVLVIDAVQRPDPN